MADATPVAPDAQPPTPLEVRAVELATERDIALRMHAVQFERANRLDAEVRRIASQRDEFEAEKDGAWAEVERLRESIREAFALGAAWALGDDDEAPAALKARAETSEAEVERLRAVLTEVQRVFNLQCPPMPAEKYATRGAWVAHSWWNTVLGSILERANLTGEVGTGAGEGATGQDTGTAWVTRSTDCPEAPAQAHLPADEVACPTCGGSIRFCECMDDPFAFSPAADGAECPGLCGEHHWLDRPESDTRECLICGAEAAG